MNDMTIFTNNTVRMTSREIAELVGTRNAEVKRSIERLAVKGVIQEPPTAILEEINSLGLTRKTAVYVFEGPQGKRDSIVVVAQLSPEFTARLVDRWQELEARAAEPQYKIPQTYLEALEAHLESLKRVEALEHQVEEQEDIIEVLEPKAQFHDEVADATGVMSMSEAAARLHIGTVTLFKVLRAKGILMKTDKYNTPYQTYRSAGYFVVKTSKFRGYDGMTHLSHTTYVTPKGLTFLFKQLQNW